MIPNRIELKKILKAKGLMPTYQRLRVLEYMRKNMKSHPTVEIIYDALKKEIPTISMTTIYNTLNALLKKRLASAVTITGTEIRYDYSISSHHHLLCRKCRAIINVDIDCPFTNGEKTVVDGHKIEEVHGYFKGLCKNCLKISKTQSKHQPKG